jgi:hypothetical protein
MSTPLPTPLPTPQPPKEIQNTNLEKNNGVHIEVMHARRMSQDPTNDGTHTVAFIALIRVHIVHISAASPLDAKAI